MSEEKKVFVSIYCKLPNDSFSTQMVGKMATGKEIYDFLMKDASLSFDEKGELIPGDPNLWYLGCNEQYGCLQHEHFISSWDIGDSSFGRIEAFVSLLYLKDTITRDQYRSLIMKFREGRLIDNFRDIPGYLKAKKEGKPWIKTKEALEFREKAKRFAQKVEDHLQGEGFMFIDMVGRSF